MSKKSKRNFFNEDTPADLDLDIFSADAKKLICKNFQRIRSYHQVRDKFHKQLIFAILEIALM